MLSIKPIGGSSRQIGYYTQLGNEDYYMQGGEPPGRWWGTGAKRLGLTGQVDASQFADLLRGYLTTPEGKKKLVQNAGRPGRRSGFDLTFSASKSVSVLWSLSDQQQRRDIEDCLQRAVTKALEAFVELCGQTRRGKQGLLIEPADLAVAMFRHETARSVDGGAPDPHLHWHAVVCNLSVRADGSTGSFDARRLFQPHMKMLLGAFFRAELARELQQIGLDVYRPINDRGKRVSWFELSCVPPELVKAFSKRRQVVQQWLNERSLEGARAAERAAVATRTQKTSHTREQLLAAWQEVGREHGFNARESLSLQPNNAHRDNRREGKLAIQEALKEITEQRARFSEVELLRFTAQAAQGRFLGIDDIFQLVEQTIQHSPELVRLQDSDGERQYTTREMLAVEQRLFRAVARLHRESVSSPTAAAIERTLGTYPTVKKEQADAVRHITQQTNRIACVNGLAGTGKTFAMQVAREIWEQAGNKVLGTTLAAKARQTLQAGSGIESLHLHPLLHQLATGQRELTNQHVVVLDEAGMVGTRQMEDLTGRVAASGAKLVLVGDHRQLSAIEAGAPFRGIAERIGTAEPNDITRQRESWARKAVVEFSQGQAVAALKKYTDRGLFFVGDRVLCTRNKPSLLLKNGSTGTVIDVDLSKQLLRIRLDDGYQVQIDTQLYPHLDWGYTLSIHQSQGLTVESALILTGGSMVDRELTYVQTSRARGQTRLYTDVDSSGEATQHFLTVGGTGSGKSLLQRLLMRDVLRAIRPNADRRALIFDAKGDTSEFLQQIDVTCPVYGLNPFQEEHPLVQQAAWDVAADITSPARALNLAATLIPAQPKDSNRYFTDAARQVLAGVVESFIRHSPGDWSFADLVLGTESRETVETILSRDRDGQLIVASFLSDARTGFQIFTTLVSRMAYFRTVAARWSDFSVKLSLREWLQQESILMIGSNAAMQTALEAVNEIVFRVLVEEIDEQRDSETRRTWFWMDEARLSGPLLKSSLIPYLCVKGRSRGVCLVLSFQNSDGFKEAAGEQIAHEIIAQCSHKALLRMESPSGTSWASSMIGGYESLELFRSIPAGWGRGETRNEQLTKRDTVLASEFSQIPFTSRANGLTGYFISPRYGVVRGVLKSSTLSPIAPGKIQSDSTANIAGTDQTQWLAPWLESDRQRLRIAGKAPQLAEPAKHRSATYRKGNVFQWDGFPQSVPGDATK